MNKRAIGGEVLELFVAIVIALLAVVLLIFTAIKSTQTRDAMFALDASKTAANENLATLLNEPVTVGSHQVTFADALIADYYRYRDGDASAFANLGAQQFLDLAYSGKKTYRFAVTLQQSGKETPLYSIVGSGFSGDAVQQLATIALPLPDGTGDVAVALQESGDGS